MSEPDDVNAMIDASAMPEADREQLRTVLRVSQGGGSIREAREHSGLTIGQAARLSGVGAERLAAIETNPSEVTTQEWAMLVTLYDVPNFTTPRPDGHAADVLQCRACGYLTVAGGPFRHAVRCSEQKDAT